MKQNQSYGYTYLPGRAIYNQIFNVVYFALMASVLLSFIYGIFYIGLEAHETFIKNKAILIESETKLIQIKESVKASFHESKATRKVDYHSVTFWISLIFFWGPYLFKFILSGLPIYTFKNHF